MQTYTTMKNSGVAWLGDIPANWNVKRPKTVFIDRREKSRPDDEHLTPSQKYAVLPQKQYMELTGGRVVLNLTGADNMKHVESGDFVIHLRSFQGGIEYSKFTGKVSNAYTVIEPSLELSQNFYRYVLKSHGFISDLASTTDQLRDGQSIKFSTFDLVKLPVPGYETQERIADYLDEETTLIDDLIAKQQHLLELLEEKCRATITAAVHPNTSMTEERFRDICALNPATQSSFKDDDVVSFYPMESIGDDGTIDHSQTRPYSAVKTGYTVFQNDDVTVAKVTPCFENHKGAHMTGIASGVGFGTTELFVLRANEKVTPEYLYWLTQAQDFNDYLAGGMRGTGGLKRVVPEELKNYKVNIPTPGTQKQIVADLLEDLKKFELLKQKVAKQIDLLKERRTSLISSAVTGKIKV